jgi:Uma2 family endonuclease
MAATGVLTSRSEYDARTAAGERLEFDDGQVIEIPNNDSLQDRLKARLVRQLNRQLPDPAEAANEQSFEIVPNQVRHPDVAVCLHPQAAVPFGKRARPASQSPVVSGKRLAISLGDVAPRP